MINTRYAHYKKRSSRLDIKVIPQINHHDNGRYPAVGRQTINPILFPRREREIEESKRREGTWEDAALARSTPSIPHHEPSSDSGGLIRQQQGNLSSQTCLRRLQSPKSTDLPIRRAYRSRTGSNGCVVVG